MYHGLDEDSRSRSAVLKLKRSHMVHIGSPTANMFGSGPNQETYLLTFKLNPSEPMFSMMRTEINFSCYVHEILR